MNAHEGFESGEQPTKATREYSTARDRLKALQVGRLQEPGLYHDGAGLYLQISKVGTKSWLFRYRLHGRLRDMGLGSFKDFTLAEARERARLQRQLVADKIDPIEQRESRRVDARTVVAQSITFEECAKEYHKKESEHWKNPKHRAQWINTLRDYAFPKLGKRKVHTIRKEDVIAALEPIWKEKPETASRVRQRMKAVLEWASAKDLYPNYPHGMWTDISKVLGTARSKADKGHHAACPYRKVGSVIQAVRASHSQDIVKLAFEFTILTAARSGETRGALWTEIDWRERVWVIPGPRMKGKKEHRVPLTARCIEILTPAKDLTGETLAKKSTATPSKADVLAPLIFCHPLTRKPFSDAVFTSLIHKGLDLPFTMHGFRSSFRDWGAEKTTHARELLEVSLAHLKVDAWGCRD